jgi:transposase
MKSGYKVIELNPIQTHKQKKRGIRKVKTDPIDANRIAQVYYLNDFQTQSPLPQCVTELKNLSRQYEKITQLYRETQLKFRSIVDLIFPQFDTTFTNLCCKTSLKVISAFPLLLSIPGVGKLTAATIIGEIGDVNRFPTTKQLITYAGLNPTVYQSGRFKASNNKISKRGSTYLRKSLYQATTAAIRKVKGEPNNPTLYDYYTKKRNEGKPYKVAVIATASKLLRIIYGVWKNNEKFIIK